MTSGIISYGSLSLLKVPSIPSRLVGSGRLRSRPGDADPLLPPGVSTGAGRAETGLGGGGGLAGDQPPTTGAKHFLSPPCQSPSEWPRGDLGADTGPCCWHPTEVLFVVQRQLPCAEVCPWSQNHPIHTNTPVPRSQVSYPWEA